MDQLLCCSCYCPNSRRNPQAVFSLVACRVCGLFFFAVHFIYSPKFKFCSCVILKYLIVLLSTIMSRLMLNLISDLFVSWVVQYPVPVSVIVAQTITNVSRRPLISVCTFLMLSNQRQQKVSDHQ